jgi:hypothetical protein
MIWNLDGIWIAMAIAVVGIIAFFLSLGLDALMRNDGFGATGNAAVITAGFFLSVYLFNLYGIRFREAADAAMMGAVGAFAIFFVLALLKALANRFL